MYIVTHYVASEVQRQITLPSDSIEDYLEAHDVFQSLIHSAIQSFTDASEEHAVQDDLHLTVLPPETDLSQYIDTGKPFVWGSPDGDTHYFRFVTEN